MNYVIIGNSAAGIGCVEGIRQVDKTGNITVISDENHHVYSRPLISYLVQGKVKQKQMMYRGDNFYIENNVKLLKARKVVKIDAGEKTLNLSDGERIGYDKLLIATGSRAFVPEIEGMENVKSKTAFMSLDDAVRLESFLDPEKKVLILGAGLIGLKCAEGILNRVKNISIVDLAPNALPSILDAEGAALVQTLFEERGVNFFFSKRIKKFNNSPDGKCENIAVLDDGQELNFDILVLAAGVRPNTELLSEIAEIGRGIIVNDRSETSIPGIYSAGDCTEYIDVSSGQRKVMALLPNAYMQGECAGVNMAGGEKIFNKAIPMNAIGFLGFHIITAGNYSGEVYKKINENSYRKLFHSENCLNGYIFMGNIEKAGIYTHLIRDKTPLDSIDFELICERPGLMAFTKEVRAQKLGA